MLEFLFHCIGQRVGRPERIFVLGSLGNNGIYFGPISKVRRNGAVDLFQRRSLGDGQVDFKQCSHG